MNLVGNKVRIRNISRADIPLLVKWKNDPIIADFVRGGPINTTFEIENRRYEKGLGEHDAVRLIIETLKNEAVGFISLGDIDKDNMKAEVGMLIGEKKLWHRGLGTDALVTLLRHLFIELGFHRVGLEVFEYNNRAKSVYEKIGFRVEGLQRQGLFRNGRYYDIILMGILQEEFLTQYQLNKTV